MQGTYNAAGYSYQNLGGDATYGIIPNEYLEQDCVIPFDGDTWFHGSLAEPLSCVIGACHANYHTKQGSYVHEMEIVKGGKTAALAAVGPMGLALLDYLIHREHKPQLLVVTDIDEARLARAAEILTVEDAAKNCVKLMYLNTKNLENPAEELKKLSDGEGFDDVFCFAPVAPVVQQGDAILAYDGCLNFFAGPSNTEFSAPLNFYNVHYNATHITGTSGGNTDDMREALDMAAKNLINPSILVTHIGGLNAAKDATCNLPNIPGGKKLIYTHINMPLTAISDFETLGKDNAMFLKLHEICTKTDGLWSTEAEKYLLENAAAI
jgi:threonine dehydrogenase-like Zn-dependent dehydrogenase